jgi:hypothetical protein
MSHSLHRTVNRASLKVEELEDRNVMSVFVTPPVISVDSLRHLLDHHHGRGEAGGVITVHVFADDAAGRSLLSTPRNLTETFTLDVNGTMIPISGLGTPRLRGDNGFELNLQFSRAALARALGSAELNSLTGQVPVLVSVSNATDTEMGAFLLVGHQPHGPMGVPPAHHSPPAHHGPTGQP